MRQLALEALEWEPRNNPNGLGWSLGEITLRCGTPNTIWNRRRIAWALGWLRREGAVFRYRHARRERDEATGQWVYVAQHRNAGWRWYITNVGRSMLDGRCSARVRASPDCRCRRRATVGTTCWQHAAREDDVSSH
jgi:hypothetical protein